LGSQIITNIPVNNYKPTSALPTGAIQWWIRATGAPGATGWSYAGRADTTPRAAVTGPRSTAGTMPTITWNVVPGAGRYILHVEKIGNPGVAVIRENKLTTTQFSAGTLEPGAYRAWIKAIDFRSIDFETELWSNGFDFTVAASAGEPSDNLLNSDDGAVLVSLPKPMRSMLSVPADEQNEQSHPSALVACFDATREDVPAEISASRMPLAMSLSVKIPASRSSREEAPELAILDTLMGQPLLLTAMLD